MNRGLLKYYLKSDLINGAISISAFIVFLVVIANRMGNSIVSYMSILMLLAETWGVFYLFAIYLHIVNPSALDVHENMNITRNGKFNLMLSRYCVAVVLPYLIVSLLLGLVLRSVETGVGLNYSQLLGRWAFDFFIVMIFMNIMFTSGMIIVAVLLSVASFVLIQVISAVFMVGLVYNDSRELILAVFYFVLGAIILIVNKQIYEKREIEKLGGVFIFNLSEKIFALCVSLVVSYVFSAVIFIFSLNFIGAIIGAVLVEVIYFIIISIIASGDFVRNLRKEMRVIWNWVLPIGIYLGLSFATIKGALDFINA